MTKRKPALLLAPGAGADRTQSSLIAIEEAAAKLTRVVVRMDFPYRKAGRKAPDRQPVLVDAVCDEASPLVAKYERLVLGGRSMGGRMCSIAVAEGLVADGLVLVSYPLHPPGRPSTLRVDHFPHLEVPCLFVSGTRDAFGTPTELRRHARKIPGPVTHVWIEGGDHGLRNRDGEVASAVADWLLTLDA